MFADNVKVSKMVGGAFKKLKSYYFYDKTILFIKHKIAVFESDRVNFQLTLEKITNSLINQDIEYFNDLMDTIDFRILPKKFKSTTNDNDVISNYIDRKKDIQKINFFIDVPVELYILDTLWLLLIGKIMTDQHLTSSFSFAGRFKKSLFVLDDESLFSGIDFDSNRCFEPYYNLYSKWRDSAFDKIKSKHSDTDTLLIGLDLKSFYYTVEFEFSNLKDLLNNDERYDSFTFLTNIIEELYLRYTNILREFKPGISKKENACIFPIGLLSPILLRELYLKKFDLEIINKIKPFYYGRYVDDLLIVVNAKEMSEYRKQDFIDHFLINTNIVSAHGKEYHFTLHSNLRLQAEKINCFFFGENQKDIILEIYDEQIRVNSSEVNLLPDAGLLDENFNSHAYHIGNLEKSNNIRELGFMESNNFKASLFINRLLRLLSNTVCCDQEYEKYLNEIIEFYSGSQSVEFSNVWRSIFELFTICNDKIKANKFYDEIKISTIALTFDKLDINEIYKRKQTSLIKKLRKNLQTHLDIALSLAVSLDYSFGRLHKHHIMAKSFRLSNMLNHHLVFEPLINYSSGYNTVSLIKSNNVSQQENNLNSRRLDTFLLKWSPRYIHLSEFYINAFMFTLNDKSFVFQSIGKENKIFNSFLFHNNLPKTIKSQIIENDLDTNVKSNVAINTIKISGSSPKKIRIAIANLNFKEPECFDYLKEPGKILTIKYKQRLFSLLNSSCKENINVIVFPEFCIPSPWLEDIAKFSQETGITIIFGLQYLKSVDKKSHYERAYNVVMVIKPTQSYNGFRNSILLYREKNYYAPAEKIELAKRGYICKDKPTPVYHVIKDSTSSFSIILCFEFTDINSRTSLKSKIDTLFVPQFNRDTTYFSSIVESTSRDLHCFVIQANTSLYGDSRINAPYSSLFKNIAQIKGGLNDSILVGEININELKQFREEYNKDYEKKLLNCLQCTKYIESNYSNSVCKDCDYQKKESHIKNIPPNF